MIRGMAALFLAMLTLVVHAQESGQPIIRMALDSQSAVPGQPIILRLTVLVPAWMPKPPVLPSFDLPNLMVRLPPRSTGPVSERIDGETWSGLSRRYRLYPLVGGTFSVAPQLVEVHFADPRTREPILAEMRTDAFTITGLVPESAVGLDPFVAATGLRLEQVIEGNPDDLEPGDAITRKVSALIEGAPPMMIPPLTGPAPQGLAAYPTDPLLDEKSNAAVLSGSRVETVTYVAETGGRFVLPAVRVRWYNLDEDRIETAVLDRFEIAVRGPPAAEAAETDWRATLVRWGPIVFGLVIAVLLARRLWRPIVSWRERRRLAYLASEKFALRQAERALGKRQLAAALGAVAEWWRRHDRDRRPLPEALSGPLLHIGAALYGGTRTGRPDSGNRWVLAIHAVRNLAWSERGRMQRKKASRLPALNPRPPGPAKSGEGDLLSNPTR